MLLDAELDLSFCDFGGSKNADYHGEGLPDFGFFDPRVDCLDITASTEMFGLGSSMYTILVGHLPHGPSILKTAKERLDYADVFKRFALKGKFPDTSQILGGDIIRDCWNHKIRSAEEAHQRLMKLQRLSSNPGWLSQIMRFTSRITRLNGELCNSALNGDVL